VQNLPQEELHGGDWREHVVAPRGIPDLATQRENGVGLQQRGPLGSEALEDGGDTQDRGVTSWTVGVLTPMHTGDAWRISTSMRPQGREHEFWLT
jgi:hypothetical protein